MKCKNILGHKWGKWEQCQCRPKKEGDGKLYKQFLQVRACEKCNYEESEWLPKSEEVVADKTLAEAIHYPECWDTMAYPTLLDALKEVGCNPDNCSQTE